MATRASVKDDDKYEALKRKGMSKQRAARIANSGEEGSKKGGRNSGGKKSSKKSGSKKGSSKKGSSKKSGKKK
jgi:hypothetical protein